MNGVDGQGQSAGEFKGEVDLFTSPDPLDFAPLRSILGQRIGYHRLFVRY